MSPRGKDPTTWPVTRRGVFSVAEQDYLLRHHQTLPRPDLARHLGRKLSSVDNWLCRKGFPSYRSLHRQGLSEDDKQYLTDHYGDMATRDLAKALGLRKAQVWKAAAALGLTWQDGRTTVYTTGDLARTFATHTLFWRKRIDSGALKATFDGRYWLVHERDLGAWLRDGGLAQLGTRRLSLEVAGLVLLRCGDAIREERRQLAEQLFALVAALTLASGRPVLRVGGPNEEEGEGGEAPHPQEEFAVR